MKKHKVLKRIIIAAVIVVIIVIVLSVLGKKGASNLYTEVEVSRGDIVNYLEFSGNVKASETKNVYLGASAKVVELYFEEGDKVEEGDVIAVLDDKKVRDSIEAKELSLEQSKTSAYYNLKDAKTNLNNLQTSVDQGLNANINSAQKALLNAQESYYQAAEAYNSAQHTYAVAKDDYDNERSSSIFQAKQSVESAEASLYVQQLQNKKSIENGGTASDLTQAEVSLSNAKSSLGQAKETVRRQVEDYKDAAQSAYEKFQKAEADLLIAQNDYETTMLSINQSLQGYKDTIEKINATSSTATSELDIEQTKETLDDYVVKANMTGYLTTLSLQEGEYFLSDKVAAVISDFDELEIEINIDEYDIGTVSEGQDVDIYVNALDKHYEGKITSVGKVAKKNGDISYVVAKVSFKTDDNVMSGLSCEVKLLKDNKVNIIMIPQDVVQYHDDRSAYCLVKGSDGTPVETDITLGVADGSNIEVVSGLSDGDIILYIPQNAYQSMITVE